MSPALGPTLVQAAVDEGVDGLIGPLLLSDKSLPHQQLEEWLATTSARAAIDALRHQELVRVAGWWHAAGLEPLVLKGGGLAYTHYAHPWQRPQDDLDLWCDKETAPRLMRGLESLGYTRITGANSEATHQRIFVRTGSGGIVHQIEVHLRIANPALFASALTFHDARADAVPVPQLDGALTLSPVHALLLACIHRVAHHFNSRRLIWLYDIHLLAGGLSQDEWARFVDTARRAGMLTVCQAGLTAASDQFRTDIPAAVWQAMSALPARPADIFLKDGIREATIQWLNFRHASSWRARAMLLWSRLFPSADFMLERYGVQRRIWLPLLYAYRVVTRLPKWFVPYAPR